MIGACIHQNSSDRAGPAFVTARPVQTKSGKRLQAATHLPSFVRGAVENRIKCQKRQRDGAGGSTGRRWLPQEVLYNKEGDRVRLYLGAPAVW